MSRQAREYRNVVRRPMKRRKVGFIGRRKESWPAPLESATAAERRPTPGCLTTASGSNRLMSRVMYFSFVGISVACNSSDDLVACHVRLCSITPGFLSSSSHGRAWQIQPAALYQIRWCPFFRPGNSQGSPAACRTRPTWLKDVGLSRFAPDPQPLPGGNTPDRSAKFCPSHTRSAEAILSLYNR